MKAVAAAALVLAFLAAKAEAAAFEAGAAKVDITPAVSALKPGDQIRDSLSVRAIYIGNGRDCAVLVGVDTAGISDSLAKEVIEHGAELTGCAARNFVLSATHTHSGSTRAIMEPGEPGPARIADAILAAVSEAKTSRRPARLGYGTGRVDLNVNRDLLVDNRWVQGPNPDGPSDKTVAIIQFIDETDHPIGVYVNYAMHPIHFYLSGVISSDVPGEVSRYIEQRFGDKTVAIFAQGASGDQNPNLSQPIFDLIDNRTGAPNANDTRVSRPGFWIESAAERDVNARLSAASSVPLPFKRRVDYDAAMTRASTLVSAKGVILGETVLDVMRFGVAHLQGDGEIGALADEVTCPGRDRQDGADPVREGALPPYADGKSVHISQTVLRLADIYLVGVNGEVYSEIAMRLKREASAAQVMMTTLANGWSNAGYIYSNAAGPHLTFQVISSRLKPGCAEDAMVSSATAMIRKLSN